MLQVGINDCVGGVWTRCSMLGVSGCILRRLYVVLGVGSRVCRRWFSKFVPMMGSMSFDDGGVY